jgi:hypothetical protein
MLSRSAITKLKAIFIIDVIVVAIAAGTYLYLQNQGEFAAALKPAEFTVTNLIIKPVEAGVGEPITISVNVTNVGDEEGNYSVNLIINDVVKETKTIQLLGAESKIVEFIVTENNAGSYSVKIEGLTETFIITDVPPPSTLRVSDLVISPYEAWVNETIKISVKVSNIGNEADSYWLAFRVNGVVRETKTIQLSAGETKTVEANVTESSEGTYSVIVGGLTGKFYIVPTGKHTLIVNTAYAGASFTLDGKSYTTPYSELLDVGTHTIMVPYTIQTRKGGILNFERWGDEDTSTTKTINLQSRMLLVPTYKLISGIASCPSLYVWNGTNYMYRTEISSGTGYLGIFDYFREYGSLAFLYSYPWDYIKLDRSQLQPRNGYYDMTLTQLWDEIFYIDSAKLVVVDHSPSVDVFSTMGTYLYNLDGQGTIYTVSKHPSTPISAVNGEGQNCLSQISKIDGIYTESHGDFHWDNLTLNLGDLSGAKSIKLVVAGITTYSSGRIQGEWAGQFWNRPGEKPFPPPYMEVKAANGSWVRVPDNRQFPLVDVTDDSFVVDLTGLFPTNDYSLRINTFFDVQFDYIGVDTTPQQYVKTQQIAPSYADLTQIRQTSSNSSGNFTRYGDITALLQAADDEFVIGRQGDSVSLQFNTAAIAPVPAGMERDYFFFVSCWFKVPGLPYLSFTVDPLPFTNMTAFPYWPPESYPYDAAHLSYLREYNTRVINVP